VLNAVKRAWRVGTVADHAGKLRQERADRRRDGGQGGHEAGTFTAGWFTER
jgi:hypothetical protein